MKQILLLFISLLPMSTFAMELINDFEWLEPSNKVEVVVGEPYQLKFNCSNNSLPFTNDYANSWNHYDFDGGQHIVNPPTGYSIDDKGVITGLIPGSYAIKFTGWIQAKSGADKLLRITVVSERSEKESNNTLDTANDIYTKIRFGLYNISDVDYIKYTNTNLKPGDYVTFKIHYYGSRDEPFGYKWATFSGTNMVGGGSLMTQDQECNALVVTGNTVYLEVYYDQSRSQYFNYGEEFVAEVYANGKPEGSEEIPDDNKNELNGHEYVDLGLPSGKCWATTNYGSDTPEGYGSYLEWEYNTIISSNWGAGWTTPSLEDILELENNCTWTWEERNGHNGYTVIGKNGNSIFLPASGYMMMGQSSAKKVGDWVYYWTSSLSDDLAYIIMSTSSNVWYGEMDTSYTKIPIRPITKDIHSSDNDDRLEGEGTETSPYLIKNAEDLIKFAHFVNAGNSFSGTHISLSNNIDMTGLSFEPIGNKEHPFSGIFDGKGYVIKGINYDATSYIGLFGFIDNALINDVGVENIDIRGWNYIGGIAGYSKNSQITNCYTRGSTMGDDSVGALVGFSGEGTIIQNCFSSMQHTKYQINGSVGGLVGYNCGLLENCYYYGTINAMIFQKSTTGGIVGYNHTTGAIHYCYFIKYGDVMNGGFNYCGSLNWGDCYGTDTFDLYGITTSGKKLYAKLNNWVDDYCNDGRYRKWTSESFPSFSEYAEPVEHNDRKDVVDLGLPSGLLWATTNVGAKYPEEYGSYFAWAETTPKSEYSWATYKYANGSETTLTKYCTSSAYGSVDYKETLEEMDDAATANWGKPWRTPTLSETQELVNYCTWTYTTKDGVSGYVVTGTNGNSIFLPACGVKQHNMTFYSKTDACIQSATLFNANNGKPSSASVLYCENGTPHYWYGWSRCWGYTVRPVTIIDPSAVNLPSAEANNKIGIYDLRGVKRNGLNKGLNIIRKSDGSTMKIINK